MATVQHANFIEYGRRGPRGGAQSNEESFDPELFGKCQTVQTSMRGVKILQQKEFDRIQSSLTAKEVQRKELEAKEKEKQRLKELSRKQVSTWSNTIAGQHKAKLEAKKLREEREAEIRHQEDIKEGIYQAEKRRKAIEHARRLTFNKTDRVKQFHGALILTEVLKEREAQLALKKRRQAARNQKERNDLEATLEEILEAKDVEAQNELTRRVARKETQKYQLGQYARKQAAEQALEDEKLVEAELIKKDVAAYHKENEAKQERLALKKKEMMDTYFAHLEEKKKLLKRAKDIEEAETREVSIFKDYKVRVDNIKKEKLAAEWARDEEKTKKNEANFLRIKAETERAQGAHFQQVLAQKTAEEDAKIEAKERKHRQDVLDIFANVQRKMKQTEDERQERLEKERIEGLEKFAEDRKWHEAECARAEKRRKAARKVLDFNKVVAKDKIESKKAIRETDLNFDRGIIMKNVEDESIFQKYAKEVIDEAIEKERNPYALQRVADTGNGGGRGPKFEGIGGLRPSYMTADLGGNQMPNRASRANATKERLVKPLHIAKKRLGFSHW